jgi:uroporphyrinogen decarboxylase
MASAGADVIGLDWRVDLAEARRRLGPNLAVQGNLDPIALLASWEALRDRAKEVLARAGGHPGHVFNLGHGVLPETPVEQVRRLVDYVHEASSREPRT